MENMYIYIYMSKQRKYDKQRTFFGLARKTVLIKMKIFLKGIIYSSSILFKTTQSEVFNGTSEQWIEVASL